MRRCEAKAGGKRTESESRDEEGARDSSCSGTHHGTNMLTHAAVQHAADKCVQRCAPPR
jgi:hypothetical protein